MKLEFHPEAELELIEAAAYYELQVPGVCERSRLRSDTRPIFCFSTPRSVPPADPVLRKLVLNRFPFTLFYGVTSDVLRIEDVAHQSRRPGYWRSRVVR